METIVVTNQKGGTGKTTTVGALLHGLSDLGKRVLGIDMDAQGNLSYSLRADTKGATISDVLNGDIAAEDAIQHLEGFDFICYSRSLAKADKVLTETGKEFLLKEALETLAPSYDYAVIDTPPALGILTVNALAAADRVIIPAQADAFSLQGVGLLLETLTPIKKYCNPSVKVDGILLTRYNPRTNITKEVTEIAERAAKSAGAKVYASTIRECTAIKEAQAKGESIFKYAPGSNAAADYRAFIEEVVGE